MNLSMSRMDNKICFGLKLFAVANILIGIFYVVFYSFSFIFAVLGGWVTDREFYGFWDWLFMVIIDRFIIATFFVSSLFLAVSGYNILRLRSHARKTAILASLILASSSVISILSELIKSKLYPKQYGISYTFWSIVDFVLILYAVCLIFYFNTEKARFSFKDSAVRLPIKQMFGAIVISFFLPLIWWIPSFLVSYLLTK